MANQQIEAYSTDLYRAGQVRELDRTAIEEHGISGLVLMERAGAAAFAWLRETWPQAQDFTILCGVGNNGGDGFVVARLVLEAGLTARVLQLGDPACLCGDARTAAEAYRTTGGEWIPFNGLPERTDVIVDALLGTGLEREVTGAWGEALEAVNCHSAPVFAIDIPSGLHSDTGQVLGIAARAAATISFIGLKQGLFTGEGPEQCGQIRFDGLGVPPQIYSTQTPSASRMAWSGFQMGLKPRSRSAYKGDFGHLLVIGGECGFSGAARMAGEAAMRSGAGLVSIATRRENAALMNMGCPELMCHAVEERKALAPLLVKADVIAIGPGLGQSAWSMAMLDAALQSRLPLVMDADALNLLAADPARRDDWVLTPHPGEAARLLGCDTAEVVQDRFRTVRRLQERYGGVVVLKGAGTLVHGGSDRPIGVCTDGNPGMASGGMGDLLTGMIAALQAQGLAPEEAARMGVSLHGAAGDRAAERGEHGLLASDLMAEIRPLLNPGAAGFMPTRTEC